MLWARRIAQHPRRAAAQGEESAPQGDTALRARVLMQTDPLGMKWWIWILGFPLCSLWDFLSPCREKQPEPAASALQPPGSAVPTCSRGAEISVR